MNNEIICFFSFAGFCICFFFAVVTFCMRIKQEPETIKVVPVNKIVTTPARQDIVLPAW